MKLIASGWSDERSCHMKTILVFLTLSILLGCIGIYGLTKKPIYRPQIATDQDAIRAYKDGKLYKTSGFSYQTLSGPVEIKVSQIDFVSDPSKLLSPLPGTGYGVVVIFRVNIHNQSSRHTFQSINLNRWKLVDNNGNVWNFISLMNASNPGDSVPDCVPSSVVRANILLGSAYYNSLKDLPDQLTLKAEGSFSPNSYQNTFARDFIFEMIRR